MSRGPKLVTVGERTPVQHKKSCSDCPWSRGSVAGWLGGMTAEEWLRDAHGEARILCHVHLPHQCAGAATYRANTLKVPRDRDALVLPADKKRCFATPAEFLKHHVDDMGKR